MAETSSWFPVIGTIVCTISTRDKGLTSESASTDVLALALGWWNLQNWINHISCLGSLGDATSICCPDKANTALATPGSVKANGR